MSIFHSKSLKHTFDDRAIEYCARFILVRREVTRRAKAGDVLLRHFDRSDEELGHTRMSADGKQLEHCAPNGTLLGRSRISAHGYFGEHCNPDGRLASRTVLSVNERAAEHWYANGRQTCYTKQKGDKLIEHKNLSDVTFATSVRQGDGETIMHYDGAGNPIGYTKLRRAAVLRPAIP